MKSNDILIMQSAFCVGLCALSPNSENCFLAYPGSNQVCLNYVNSVTYTGVSCMFLLRMERVMLSKMTTAKCMYVQ